jgi:hypothetical protein
MAMLRNTDNQLRCLSETVVVTNIFAMFPGTIKFAFFICSAINSGEVRFVFPTNEAGLLR